MYNISLPIVQKILAWYFCTKQELQLPEMGKFLPSRRAGNKLAKTPCSLKIVLCEKCTKGVLREVRVEE